MRGVLWAVGLVVVVILLTGSGAIQGRVCVSHVTCVAATGDGLTFRDAP